MGAPEFLSRTRLREAFARRLSAMYGAEVPAYVTLTDVVAEVNAEVLAERGTQAERLGTMDRVGAERHGAVRVGTAAELRAAARLFAALGMHPVGFYDLRDAGRPVPVVSTAFRPLDRSELARNPFRVFISVLITDDRRFFTRDLQARLDDVLSRRRLFPPELLMLADRSATDNGLPRPDAERFLDLAVTALEVSDEPIDRRWHDSLARVSSVAADIGGSSGTHVNHLTPRVLDIDRLYERMQARGIAMIERIQGPPRWRGPEVLLRQTSFRALDEPRRFREVDGTITSGAVRVRFGEVESRGVALTDRGRELHARLSARTDELVGDAADAAADRPEIARTLWEHEVPDTETGLAVADLAFYTVHAVPGRRVESRSADPGGLSGALERGLVRLEPIVYEDFLPRSAAGIFASNLIGTGEVRESEGSRRDVDWLAAALDADVADPTETYAAERDRSVRAAAAELALDPDTLRVA